jgi:hypothetical protein
LSWMNQLFEKAILPLGPVSSGYMSVHCHWNSCFLFSEFTSSCIMLIASVFALLLSIIRKLFKQIHLYTILIQGTSTIFVDQVATYLVLKKSTFFAGIEIFDILPTSMTILQNYKANFKAGLRRYLHTHSFYAVH